MSDSNKKTGDGRQITYRVGWKSGTIHLEDKKRPTGGTLADYSLGKSAAGAASARKPHEPPVAAPRRSSATPLERAFEAMLRPAPLPSARAWTVVLFAMPPAAFAALCWLTLRLSAAA